jgi:hypothetical protein
VSETREEQLIFIQSALKPTNSSCRPPLNDFTKSPTLWNGATAGIDAQAVLEEEKRLGRDLTFAERKLLTARVQEKTLNTTAAVGS